MKNIYVDIDDTIAEHTLFFIKFFQDKYNINLNKEELSLHDYSQILNSRLNLKKDLFNEFHNSSFFQQITPMQDSKKVIKNLSALNKIFVISARPYYLTKITHSWISKHFLNCFSDVFLVNQYPRNNEKKGPDKLGVCKKLNCSVAIEDDPETSLKIANSGIKVLLFDQPWNKKINQENITRVNNWKEIYNILVKEEMIENGYSKSV